MRNEGLNLELKARGQVPQRRGAHVGSKGQGKGEAEAPRARDRDRGIPGSKENQGVVTHPIWLECRVLQ